MYNISNMVSLLDILDYLSDGQFHSGEDLAEKFAVSRTAIWKQIKKLNTLLPMEVMSVSGKGYKIEFPISVLNKRAIIEKLRPGINGRLNDIDIMLSCSSTNQYLLEKIEQYPFQNRLVLSELQTQGRGRRGKEWISPFASNVYMSLLWSLDVSIAQLSGLSLVVAISVASALKTLDVSDVMLKWPNDIYVGNKKLSGVLLELRGESNSPCQAVIGIGVNVNMPEQFGKKIDQQWVDMQSLLQRKVDRNDVVAEILNELASRLDKFNNEGFSSFISEWEKLDLLEGKQISIEGNALLKEGIARGVDKNGALLVEHKAVIEPLFSGEVSVREKCHTC